MEPKERLVKALTKKLSPEQKQLFKLVELESRKDSIVFRMPVGLIALDSLWHTAQQIAKEQNIVIKQAGQYATLEELDEILGDVEWLWPRWIPKGFVTMVAGDPGIGKSAQIQHLVKIITDGGTFPLESKPLGKAGNAVWVDTEASQQILKMRATTMEINKKRVFLPVINGDILSQANLGFPQDREQIINLIEGVGPDILVLDSLGGAHARGENKVEDIRPVLEFLALTARDYQLSVIVIHHLNKGNQNESPEVSLYRLRGSTIIPAMCRSIIAIERGHDGNNKLRMIKSNLAPFKDSDQISVVPQLDGDENITGFTYQHYVLPPDKKTKKQQCADWAYRVIEEGGGSLAFRELLLKGEEVGYTRQNLYAARDILGDRVTYGGTGNHAVWQITQTDMEAMHKIVSGSNGTNGNKRKGKHGRAKERTN